MPLQLRSLAWWAALCGLLWAFCATAPALAQGGPAAVAQALVLDSGQAARDPWPLVHRLFDAAGTLTAEQALAATGRFEPAGPQVNLGRRSEALWLHLPLQPAGDPSVWWLAIDYASLDQIDLFLWRDGRLVQQARMGDHLMVAERPAETRQHAVALKLEASQRHELLLRVQTTSSMIVPLRLLRSAELVADEGRHQTVQGAAFGLGLVVLLYGLLGLWLLRDPVFLWFALATAAATLFFAAYTGWAPLMLWPGSPWLTRNAAPLMMVLLVASGTLFIDRSLDMPRHAPRASLAMRGVAGVASATAVLSVANLLGYHAVSAVATVTGLLPGLIALSVAYRLARAGDRIAQLAFAGWAVYSVGVVTFSLMQGARIAYGAWSANALQACSILELMAWMTILALRADRLRQQAKVARRENQRLLTMAQTDALTGLLNRRGLEQSLSALLPEVGAQRLAALYMIDLDGFKAVNDQLGHQAGDELLVQVAARLRRVLRASDLVARPGGDEFIVVASPLRDPQEAAQVGQKLLACTKAPFTLSDTTCEVGMTIGYSLAPVDGADAEALIRRADASMYAGKQAGKRRVVHAPAAPA